MNTGFLRQILEFFKPTKLKIIVFLLFVNFYLFFNFLLALYRFGAISSSCSICMYVYYNTIKNLTLSVNQTYGDSLSLDLLNESIEKARSECGEFTDHVYNSTLPLIRRLENLFVLVAGESRNDLYSIIFEESLSYFLGDSLSSKLVKRLVDVFSKLTIYWYLLSCLIVFLINLFLSKIRRS